MLNNDFSGIVTLTTDFGQEDGYAGTMKGVILNQAPQTCIVDISHNIPAFNLRQAFIVLNAAFVYFPKGTIHVMIVDPGVGSSRRHILVHAAGHYFIGPDNGVLGRIAKLHNGQTWAMDFTSIGITSASSTFHGRDVYAVAAGKILNLGYRQLATGFIDPVLLALPEPVKTKTGFDGEILYIDNFGNLVSNLRKEHLTNNSTLVIKDAIVPIVEYYSQLDFTAPGALLNSWGYIEICVKEAQASLMLGVTIGEKISIVNSNITEEKKK